MIKKIKLATLPVGSSGMIADLHIDGVMRRRLLDLGLIPNSKVTTVRKSPIGEPIAFLVRGTMLALRREDAEQISVILLEDK